ncbi:signal recognition particle receptor subunit alpha [Mycoplasma parvum]|uniref:signal-recognition-particle GTPase n=1 Tax=Mycoplasma parvum str. Indiana TaxID=1403316 RepID=U5NF63_9MOLU|nr:signal recognition particle receptor subunit alpha [Mycoplasma parvum]AGX88809.1 signal recognition particle [Mycoplasma parvum str. Indiana]
MLLANIIQKILTRKIKHNFLAKRITEKDIDLIFEDLKEEFIKSDVNLKVATQFFQELKDVLMEEKKIFLGKEEVQKELYLRIRDKLIESLGEKSEVLKIKRKGTNKYLLVGVNGVGKTTTVGKLAYYLQKKEKLENIEVVSLDYNRAAAFEQLQQLVTPWNIPSSFIPELTSTEEVNKFKEFLSSKTSQAILFDSGGILPSSPESLDYLKKLSNLIEPTETIIVIDALSGQESLDIVNIFYNTIHIDSIIVTKSDSLSPLGAALSSHYFLKLPIKFLGEGEHIQDLIPFYPDRIVSRVIGEGDLVSLADKIVDKGVNTGSAEDMFFKFLQGKFDLEDLIKQFKEIKKIGSFSGVLKMFPKLGKLSSITSTNLEGLENEFIAWEYLVQSMTDYEKKNPKVFKTESSRRVRVIKGSGRKPEELNQLLAKWAASKKKSEEMSKKLAGNQMDWNHLFSFMK